MFSLACHWAQGAAPSPTLGSQDLTSTFLSAFQAAPPVSLADLTFSAQSLNSPPGPSFLPTLSDSLMTLDHVYTPDFKIHFSSLNLTPELQTHFQLMIQFLYMNVQWPSGLLT